MKRKLLFLVTVMVAVLLVLVAVPVYAGPPSDASGTWLYDGYDLGDRTAGCNLFVDVYEDGMWSGTFNGASSETGEFVLHCNGHESFNAIVTFQNVTVEGKSGGLVLSVNGLNEDDTWWDGRWVILSGTGELSGLHGQGTFYGPGYGVVYYDGSIHFDPD